MKYDLLCYLLVSLEARLKWMFGIGGSALNFVRNEDILG